MKMQNDGHVSHTPSITPTQTPRWLFPDCGSWFEVWAPPEVLWARLRPRTVSREEGERAQLPPERSSKGGRERNAARSPESSAATRATCLRCRVSKDCIQDNS